MHWHRYGRRYGQERHSSVEARPLNSWRLMMAYRMYSPQFPAGSRKSDSLKAFFFFLAKSTNPTHPSFTSSPSRAPPRREKHRVRPPWSSSPPALVTSRSASPSNPGRGLSWAHPSLEKQPRGWRETLGMWHVTRTERMEKSEERSNLTSPQVS